MTTNNMFGGQLGLRYFQQRNAWTLSTDLRMFAMQNFVDYRRCIDTTQILYDQLGAGGDSGPTVNQTFRTMYYGHGAEFVFGGEVRAEAAYQFTRDIQFNFGFTFMDIGKGVLRGAEFTQKGEDVVMCGVNVGVNINR